MRDRQPLTPADLKDLVGLLCCVVDRLRPGTGLMAKGGTQTTLLAADVLAALDEALLMRTVGSRAVADNLLHIRCCVQIALEDVPVDLGLHEYLDAAKAAIRHSLESEMNDRK